jgi:hypothetical protein
LPAFIEAIKSEILGHRSIYDQFLEIEEILKMLDILETQPTSIKPTEMEIIDMVLDFLSYCKNCARMRLAPSQVHLHLRITLYELAQRWMKHREEIFNFNKRPAQDSQLHCGESLKVAKR